MQPIDYEALYNKIEQLHGWDFSRINCVVEGDNWDMYEEIAKQCKSSDLLLDIGTGGGEQILPLADALLLLVGIDHSPEMIDSAHANAGNTSRSNVRFLTMSANNLTFPEHFFNIVSCRQSPFCAQEVAKVLMPGGAFVTQQVAEDDKLNLKQAFRRGQAFGSPPGELCDRYVKELQSAGFGNVQHFEYRTTEYYQTAADLIFLLAHTPIIPDFGHDADDFNILHAFIQDNQTEKGIRTSSSRSVIQAIR